MLRTSAPLKGALGDRTAASRSALVEHRRDPTSASFGIAHAGNLVEIGVDVAKTQ